jgi:hypothetical protein
MKCSVEQFGVTLLVFLLAAPCLLAQTTLPQLSSGLSLDKLARPAGMIFSGTVKNIERISSKDGEPASVRITFRADEAVRGCSAGDTIVIKEWAGLWVQGDRYREGQKLFLFLYPPSPAGLTSPVAGDLGKFHLGPNGLLQLSSQQAAFLTSEAGGRDNDFGPQPPHARPPRSITDRELQRMAREAIRE